MRENVLFGKHICGRRGGLPFDSVQRPNFMTKKCPKGTQPCSKETSEKNTVCYENKDDCPVTSINFVPTDEYDNETYSTPLTKTLPFTDDFYLVYSRDAQDSLPISATLLEQNACSVADQTAPVDHDILYPLEIDRKNDCPSLRADENNPDFTFKDLMDVYEWDYRLEEDRAYKHDTRFVETGMEISLYDLEVGAGVHEKLKTLPAFARTYS